MSIWKINIDNSKSTILLIAICQFIERQFLLKKDEIKAEKDEISSKWSVFVAKRANIENIIF